MNGLIADTRSLRQRERERERDGQRERERQGNRWADRRMPP